MYINKKAFTLIELLVIVLIIGILAAIALPQYNLLVEKAHYSEAATMLKALATAEDMHLLTKGVYATKFSDLDISLPAGAQIATCAFTQDCMNTKNFYYTMHEGLTIQARRIIGNSGKNYENYTYEIVITPIGNLKKGNLLCSIVPGYTINIEKWRNFCKKMSGSSTYTSINGGNQYLIK